MKILVDADSCPRPVRDLVLRTAAKREFPVIFAANRPIPGAAGPGVRMELCPPEEGSADDRLVELAAPGDLAITRDIALAERLLEKAVRTLDDRGRRYTGETIRERLSIRNFTVALAESGLGAERQAVYGKRELKTFADAFDRELSRLRTEGGAGTEPGGMT
ncbi:MAG: DUF188 domain-containing protein [Spirochaetaceae bacterium]|jgi:uncharacterized protein YaiI (UPF0178 family)|nr:DUF188 domain-containing protein [Spirochaetaceae bacterium]